MEVQKWTHREYAYSSCSSTTLKDCDPDQNALHTHKLYRFPSLTSHSGEGSLDEGIREVVAMFWTLGRSHSIQAHSKYYSKKGGPFFEIIRSY